jgi:hypothetical protein
MTILAECQHTMRVGDMLQDNTLLIVGGTARNVGKTELVCRIIKKISADICVYALKVSAIFPDEGIYHGDHEGEPEAQYLFEETRYDTAKDTSRMLRAGAKKVFYLRGEDNCILEAFTRFQSGLPAHTAVVCESNSLAEHVRPSLLIMVTKDGEEVKPRAKARLSQADLIIVSDGNSGFTELSRIHYNPAGCWYLK